MRLHPIEYRLEASVRFDAINGDAYERSVCDTQMREAAEEIRRLRLLVRFADDLHTHANAIAERLRMEGDNLVAGKAALGDLRSAVSRYQDARTNQVPIKRR